MQLRLDQDLPRPWQVAAALLIWVFGVALFATGVPLSYPPGDQETEVLFVLLVSAAEAACVFNFSRAQTLRNAITIGQVSAWALAFWLRGRAMIGDAAYAVATAAFVFSVIYTVHQAMADRRR